MLDLTKIEFIQSPNYKLGRKSITYIVIHSEGGSHLGSISWFKNPTSQVSAHYLVSQQGEIVQMVKDQNTAWAVFGLNAQSISVEHEDKGQSSNGPGWITPTMLEKSAELVAMLMKKYNVPIGNVIGHNEPWVQKLAIAGKHPGYVHSDPGKYWPWSKYKELVMGFYNQP